MKFLSKVIIFSLVCILSATQTFAWWWDDENIAYQSEIITLEDNYLYLEIDVWFPTDDEPVLRNVRREDKFFLVANNAEPVERELELIIISTPPFAESLDFANISYALAEAGYLVATITHTNDNKFQMQKTMSAEQFYMRAFQVEKVIEYFTLSEVFTINEDTISLLSFTETALAPIMLEDYTLSSNQFESYCMQILASTAQGTNSNQSFCYGDYAHQVNAIIDGIDHLSENIYDNSSKSQVSIPKVKNYFFVEPVLTFLFEPNQLNRNNFNIYALYTEEEYFSSSDVQFDYLAALNKNAQKIELKIPNYVSVVDECPPSELPNLSEICLNISDSKRESYVKRFVETIEDILTENTK